MRLFLLLVAALALLLGALPPAQAHGLVNAGELETLVVQDEASDVVTGADYGYDLVQLYVGEAHVPGLGDGLYVHTVLYGGAGDRPVVDDGAQTVAFEFQFGDRKVERYLTTDDGQAFSGDFDHLTVVPGDGEVEVQRAFLLYPEGIGAGSVLTALRATSKVNNEPRDIAPGGVILPGARTEVAMGDSSQVIESYTLRGPTGYVSQVEVIAMTDGGFLVTAWSGLKSGEQHILLVPEEAHDGWTATIDGPSANGGETLPDGNQIFGVVLQPGEGPFFLDLYTDVGGHVRLTAEQTPEGLRLASADSFAVQPAPPVKESPASPWLALAGLAAALLVQAIRRRPD